MDTRRDVLVVGVGVTVVGVDVPVVVLGTFTVMLVVPVWPVESRTLAVTVCVPPPIDVHGRLIGPREAVVWLDSTRPSTLRVKLLLVPFVFSAHTTAVPLPLTVAPDAGAVIKTSSVPLEVVGAGVVPVAVPVTAREVVSPLVVKLTLLEKLPEAVGLKRTTTFCVAFGLSENEPPETIEKGAPTLAVPDRLAVLVFWTVKVLSTVALGAMLPNATAVVGVTEMSAWATPLATLEQPLSLPDVSTAVMRT
jgi:hypothetical protein